VGLQWRESVRDGGRFAPVRRVEFLEDVRDVDGGGFDADDELRRDLAVGVAAGEEGEDVDLARRQAERFGEARALVGERWARFGEVESRPLGEQLDFA
jgi:hypothetical protein